MAPLYRRAPRRPGMPRGRARKPQRHVSFTAVTGRRAPLSGGAHAHYTAHF